MMKATGLKRCFSAFWRLFVTVVAQFQLVQFQLIQTRAVLEATLRLRAVLGVIGIPQWQGRPGHALSGKRAAQVRAGLRRVIVPVGPAD